MFFDCGLLYNCTLPNHISSPRFLVGSWYLMLCRLFLVLCPFFLLVIVLSVLLRCNDYDYPFGIFKLFLSTGYRNLEALFVHILNFITNGSCYFHISSIAVYFNLWTIYINGSSLRHKGIYISQW